VSSVQRGLAASTRDENSSLIAQLPNNQNSSVQQYNLQVQQQLDRFTSVSPMLETRAITS
jgi:hypothetical protein